MRWILAIIFALTLCGCKTTTRIVTEYQEIQVHDTIEVERETIIERKVIEHDTLRESVSTIIRDSVILYLDSEGNVVNREHYRNEINDRNKETIRELERELDSLQSVRHREALWYQSQLNQKENEVVEVKHWYDPIAPYCIGAVVLMLVALVVWIVRKVL